MSRIAELLASLGLFISTARLKMTAVVIVFIWWKEVRIKVDIMHDVGDWEEGLTVANCWGLHMY